MSDDTYNGWTNRATWAVALHVNNDQGWQEQVHETTREALASTREFGPGEEVTFLAEWLKDNVTAIVDPLAYVEEFGDVSLSTWAKGPGLAARDIGDLDEVNWHELAESFIADVKES